MISDFFLYISINYNSSCELLVDDKYNMLQINYLHKSKI